MSTTPLPGHDKQPGDILCSSCGRFVGALTKCPHCGARVTKRLSVRLTRYAALFLAVVGLVLLYLMAVSREIPLVRIGDIEPTMNFAYVRIEGEVTQDTRVYQSGGLGFFVSDGTGEISVSAFRAVGRRMQQEGIVPRAGDFVSVAGSLSAMADDEVRLTIQVADQVIIAAAEIMRRPLGSLSLSDVGALVMVEGHIVDFSPPPEGVRRPYRLTLADTTGSGHVTFWDSVYADLADRHGLLEPGQALRLRVRVDEYRGSLQLAPATGLDFEFLDEVAPLEREVVEPETVVPEEEPVVEEEALEETPLVELGVDFRGREILTRGVVKAYRSPEPGTRQPFRIILAEGDAEVHVVYWEDVADRLGDVAPAVGSLMGVRGQVDVFRDQVQIKVNEPDHMDFEPVPVTPPAPVDEGVPIGEIDASHAGTVKTVTGELGPARSIRGGAIHVLSDATGNLEVVMWERHVPAPVRERFETGRRVTVTGTVNVYEEKLQIIPEAAAAVVLH